MSESENKTRYLPVIIGKTRKARIEAERRLLRLDALSKHASVFYACLTTLLSLASVFLDYKGLPFLSIASAVVVAICTVYSSAQNYGVRAEKMKACYLELQRLHLMLDGRQDCKEDGAESIVDEIGRRYVDILERTENHTPRDYEIASKDIGKRKDRLRWFCIRLCVYIAPVLAGIVFSLIVWPL